MARKQTKAERLAIEARRRQRDATRIAEVARRRLDATAARLAAEFQALRLEQVRRTLHEAVEREVFARRLAAAMTDDFSWQPWGYELPEPEPTNGRGLTVRHLRVVVDEREPKARQRFDRTVRYPSLARLGVGA